MRGNIARGVWKSVEQREKIVQWTWPRLGHESQEKGEGERGRGDQGREDQERKIKIMDSQTSSVVWK